MPLYRLVFLETIRVEVPIEASTADEAIAIGNQQAPTIGPIVYPQGSTRQSLGTQRVFYIMDEDGAPCRERPTLQVLMLSWELHQLRDVYRGVAGLAPRTAMKIRSAIKSLEGATRHAPRKWTGRTNRRIPS